MVNVPKAFPLEYTVMWPRLPGQILIDDDENFTLGDDFEANKLAAEWAVPSGLPIPPKPIKQRLVFGEAKRFAVHPIVIIGQLQRRKDLDWRTQLVRGAPTVANELAAWGSRAASLPC